MYNFLDSIRSNPSMFRQLAVDEQLIAEINCPLETPKEAIWTEQSYFVYVLEGKKTWHIPDRSFELTQGQCVFVKKGAHIIEQFFDSRFCLIVFFMSDRFITDTLRRNTGAKATGGAESIIMRVDTDNSLHAFFQSVLAYFSGGRNLNKDLLELKFKELLLNVTANPQNAELTNYFSSLNIRGQGENLRRIMEENFRYSMGSDDFARLCGRSLSAFKRDFQACFQTTPGRWLLNRRLEHARILIRTSSKSVSEIAFESGFENASHFSRAYKQQFGIPPSGQARSGGSD